MNTPLLCVCDLDDTLLGKDKRISKRNLEAALKIQRAGIPFTVATGRSHLQIREFISQLEIKIPVITCNGGVTSMPKSEEMLSVSYIEPQIAKEICAFCEENCLDYLMYTAKNICYTRESVRILGYFKYNAALENREFEVPLKCMDDVTDADFNEAIKILVLGDYDMLEYIKGKFNNEGKLTIVSSGKGLVDIMAPSTGKGLAVRNLAEHLGVDLSCVAVFGDSPNDIEMFETAGISVAVDNAVDAVKAVATHITAPSWDDGVADALEMLFGEV